MSHSNSYEDDKKRKADSYRDDDERKSKRGKDESSRYREKERDRKKDKRDEKVVDTDQEKRNKTSSNQSAEEKKKRLEAWKKLMAEQNLAPTTAENESRTLDTAIPEPKENKDSVQMEIPPEPTNEQLQKQAPQPEKIDEVDPLDAFMMEIQQQVRKDHGNMLLNSKQQTQTKGTSSSSKQISTDRYYSDEESGQIKAETNGDEDAAAESDDDESPLLKKLRKKNLSQVDHSKVEYPPFKKNFYIEVPEIARMTAEEVKTFREEMENIGIRGKDCPKPIKSFTQCGLSNKILKVMEKCNYTKPTPIQAQSIPAIMSGRDVIGCAKTGSGKTLSFLLPMLRHILDQPPITPGDGPIGLVMAPTRELAMQIHAEFKKFTKPLGLRCVCVYGGSGVASQIADLKRGAEIVVCTPGRMIDVLCTNGGKVTNLQRVTYLVLDEADRMFDMGFEPQIMRIINNVRPDRQTVMFSATFPRQVESLARKILTRPLEIVVGARSIVCSDVEQCIEVLPEESKFRKLLELLKTWHEKGNIIIFVDRQESADKLFTDLVKADYPALALHGGMNQQDRDFTIDDFKRKVKTILVATSVAARGLDVKDLNLVINYDVPNHMEDYVHRVGRTGRAGAKGTAITFITPDEERFAPDIAKAVQNSGATVPPDLQKLCDSFTEKKQAGLAVIPGSGYGGKGFKFDEAEEQKRQEERKRQMRAYGMEEGFLEEEHTELFEEDEETAAGEKSTATKETAAPTTTTIPKGGNLNPASLAQKLAQEIANKAKAQIAAASTEHFTEELEINDYPQQARWKVTHKDSLASITEFTNTAITTRGSFIPPGRNPAPGERKLYLVIEGPDVISVKKARAEILRILEETTLISGPDKATYGKYKVV